MQAFHIHYRNTQGTLMRILTAVSRRALDITYVHAQPAQRETYKVTLLLDVNPKQAGQLRRDWYAIMDVTDVRITSAEEHRRPCLGVIFILARSRIRTRRLPPTTPPTKPPAPPEHSYIIATAAVTNDYHPSKSLLEHRFMEKAKRRDYR